jgi:hypothetical protein
MKFTVLSAVPIDPLEQGALAPAPNATESENIENILKQDQTPPITDIFAGPINIITDYRGHMLYCAGGVGVHRISPVTWGTNGYLNGPFPDMQEDVVISSPQGRFKARVRFE